MRKMRAKDATYREIGAAVGMSDPKTVKRILDRKVDKRMLLKPETSSAACRQEDRSQPRAMFAQPLSAH
jgi:hypothetical protein